MDNWGVKGISSSVMAKITQAGSTFKPMIASPSEGTEERDRKTTPRGAPDGGKPSAAMGDRTGKKMPSDVKETIPCSPGVVGVALGARSPVSACHACNKPGHWKADCPKTWGEAGCQLPGFSARGVRLAGKWEGDNPTKATFKEWVKFIEDRANFPKGAKPAPLDNAPTLQIFKEAARKGVPP